MDDPNMMGDSRMGLEAVSTPVVSTNTVALREAVAQKTVELCLRRYSPNVVALVLTGSLARDEATWVDESTGRKLLGDAEFLLVFRPEFGEPSAVAIESLASEIQTALCQDGILAYVQLAPVHPGYFRGLRPRVFAYELQECGRVVWGDASILALASRFSAADIPLEDAWRLLANRMIEFLEATTEVENLSREIPETLRYRTVKLYLDMATSLLLFTGDYAPGYGERQRRLQGLAKATKPGTHWPFPLEKFAQQVSRATDLKLRGGWPSSTEGGWESWHEALRYARLLWDWELARLVDSPVDERGRGLMRRWMRQQAGAGFRGWMFTWRACGWLRSLPSWPRWLRLARGGSPRYWVYYAAHKLFCQLPAAISGGAVNEGRELADALRALPVVRRTEAGHPPSWKQLVDELAWNYHRFVEPTRA